MRVPPGQPRRAQASCTVEGATPHRLNAQARCGVAGNAVAQRVARGQHHAGLACFRAAAIPAGHGAELSVKSRAGRGGDVVVQQGQRAGCRPPPIGNGAAGQASGLRLAAPSSSTPIHPAAKVGGRSCRWKRVESASAIFGPSKSHTSTCRRNLPPLAVGGHQGATHGDGPVLHGRRWPGPGPALRLGSKAGGFGGGNLGAHLGRGTNAGGQLGEHSSVSTSARLAWVMVSPWAILVNLPTMPPMTTSVRPCATASSSA